MRQVNDDGIQGGNATTCACVSVSVVQFSTFHFRH